MNRFSIDTFFAEPRYERQAAIDEAIADGEPYIAWQDDNIRLVFVPFDDGKETGWLPLVEMQNSVDAMGAPIWSSVTMPNADNVISHLALTIARLANLAPHEDDVLSPLDDDDDEPDDADADDADGDPDGE